MFRAFGLPQLVVSDNGTQFTAKKFKMFLEENCIRHITSAVAHPQSNGAAENAVKTFKTAFNKTICSAEEHLEQIVNQYVMMYRNTPHATTKKTSR